MNNKAFTLIEILIVVSIIGILSAVLISVLNPARQRNRAAEVVNGESIRKIATAVEAYTSINGSYPADIDCKTGTDCGGYLSVWPLSSPKNDDEIIYNINGTYGYLITVPSKLTASKYLCYRGKDGKVFKDCSSTTCTTGCAEGVL
jgi:prepilin-type N-terminal cleavage/methylation domain-containing protein